jgi:hypothetical protein
MRSRSSFLVSLTAVAGVVLVACGSDSAASSTTSPDTSPATSPATSSSVASGSTQPAITEPVTIATTVPEPPPVVAAVGDIACDPTSPNFAGGAGNADGCHHLATSELVHQHGYDAFLALGDLQYENGAYEAFMTSYDPSWGRVKGITRPAPGNHEYYTENAAGYYRYFGAAAGDPTKGYYSFDIGDWHLVALNSNCADVGCEAGSEQEQWLRADLAAHPTACALAYWHHPRFSSGEHGDDPGMADLFRAADEGGVDVVLNGHDHHYERFALQDADGNADPVDGVREFVVGSGGKNHYAATDQVANSELIETNTFGVLQLTLHASSYDWQFVPEAGATFVDSGSHACA